MKVLFRKIKRANKVALFTYLLAVFSFIVAYIFFTISLLNLVGIETVIRIVLFTCFSIWFLVYLLLGLGTLVTRKYKKFIALSFIQFLLVGVMACASIVVDKLYSKLELISNQEYTQYTTNLIALVDTELSQDSKIGMISNNEDIEGYVLANTLKNQEGLNQDIIYYDDYFTMLSAMYKKEIDAAFVSSNYVIIFGSEPVYENIATETKVLYEYSEKMKTKTITNSNKKLTEPFTVLLMGVDSEKDGLNANAAFNGDTLMLITFNPQTLTATMFSIPRDTYVPIACNHNRSNKINSSAAYGTECVINTVQNLTGVTIDYYAKINFNGVIDLVNALGGIQVDVEQPDYNVYVKKYGKGKLCESNSLRDMSKLVCMETGLQNLNGEQTLAYARNRHGFLLSDLARNRHQQQIVEAIAKKVMNTKNFSDFENLLEVIGKNIATNLSTTQILSFYQTLKNMLLEGLKGNDFINIQKTYLEVYNLPILVGGMQVSALGYYEPSLKAIQEALNVNLGLQSEEMIKTFSYDYNEEYASPVIGKGIYGGVKEATVPNLIGSSVGKAEEWAANHGIKLTKSFMCSTSTPGLIGDQSVQIGTSLRSISSMEIYINQVCDTNNDEDEDDDNTNSNSQLPGVIFPSGNNSKPNNNSSSNNNDKPNSSTNPSTDDDDDGSNNNSDSNLNDIIGIPNQNGDS